MIDFNCQPRNKVNHILQHFNFTQGRERVERPEAKIKGVKINNFRQDLQDRHDIFCLSGRKAKIIILKIYRLNFRY